MCDWALEDVVIDPGTLECHGRDGVWCDPCIAPLVQALYDADFQCPSTIAGGREDRCGLFRFPPRCKPGACTMKDAT